MTSIAALSQLHQDIDARVHSIREDRPDWLCSKGCDYCCHRLAEIPRLSSAEWDLLQQGLTALPPQHLQAISQRMATLADQLSRPVVCPLLDEATGACPVYDQRPVACRTYGFYVQRDLGLYCHDIESRVADGSLADVVWGNHDAIEQRLRGLGETRPLTEWFAGSDFIECQEALAQKDNTQTR
jgi:Fe-S-cluster containining protein